MNRTTKTVTIEIPVEFWAKEGVDLPPLDGLPLYMRHFLTDFNDGRYPFSVEMFERAFTEIVKYGVIQATEKFCEKMFGDERIQEGNSDYMRSYREAEKIWQKIWVSIGDEDKIKVSINNKD